jgi:hypothetical protein
MNILKPILIYAQIGRLPAILKAKIILASNYPIGDFELKINAKKAFALSPKDWWIYDESDEVIDEFFSDLCAYPFYLSDCGDRIVFAKGCVTKMYKTGIKGLCDSPDDDKLI